MTNYSFFRDLPDGSSYRLGTAVYKPNGPGWRFLSNVTAHKSSRKLHDTMEKCLPRWLGYPDKCRSEAVLPRPDDEPPQPVDDGSCDPLYGQRMDSADMGEC